MENDAAPLLVEAEMVPGGRSRTQVNRKTASGRKDLAAAAPCTIFSPEDLALISGARASAGISSMTPWGWWTPKAHGRPMRSTGSCASGPPCCARPEGG